MREAIGEERGERRQVERHEEGEKEAGRLARGKRQGARGERPLDRTEKAK